MALLPIIRCGFLGALFLLSGCSSLKNEQAEKSDWIFEFEKTTLSIDVILPNSYSKKVKRYYPVIYVLDGPGYKSLMQEYQRRLLKDNMIVDYIIVSIEYPDSVHNKIQQRMKDLTPARDDNFATGGDADKFLEIFSSQLIPYIDNTYRIDSSHKVLIGHSLGGLFTLYAMYQQPDLFTHYAAISPSALWADQHLLQLDKSFADTTTELNTNAYITYGTDEYVPYVKATQKYLKQLQEQQYDKLSLTLESVEGMRHSSMIFEGFLRGTIWALSDIAPQGPSGFERLNINVNTRR